MNQVHPAPAAVDMSRKDEIPAMPVAQAVGSGVPVAQGPLGAISGRRQFVIHQVNEHLEACCACLEFKNKFEIYDALTGEQVLLANEESETCERCCCRPHHSLNMYFVRPDSGQVSFVMQKKFRVHDCFSLCNCCRGEASVLLPTGETFGTSKEAYCSYAPQLNVMDRNGMVHTNVHGPNCFGGCSEACCGNQTIFQLADATNNQSYGTITKKIPTDFLSGLDAIYTTADTYYLQVPQQLDDEKTASLLATSILLDYMMFESDNQKGDSCYLGTYSCFGCQHAIVVENKNQGGNYST